MIAGTPAVPPKSTPEFVSASDLDSRREPAPAVQFPSRSVKVFPQNSQGGTTVKLAHFVSTSLLLLLLTSAAPMLAQEERHDNGGKPAAQEEKHDQNPDVRKDQDRDLKRDQSPDMKQDEKKDRAQGEKAQDRTQDRRADERAQDRDQARDRAQADARQDRRIPDDKFRASFGREHTFRIERPVIVEGAPRFQYAGYWFVIAQPWPEGWSYDDDVYIDYVDDGYWILSPVHPGLRIALTLVF